MIAQIQNFGKLVVPDLQVGNCRLNVYPFEHTDHVELPSQFKQWEETLNEILEFVPIQADAKNHAITICSDFFTTDDFQRREGIHIDGNFCVDPNFTECSWGGLKPVPMATWGGLKLNNNMLQERSDNSHVIMDWVLPYDIVIPIGEYVSENKGGLFVVSSNVGTKAWDGEIPNNVKAEGSMEHLAHVLTDDTSIYVPKNELVFMTSNTPHKTLPISAGTRRTFMRLTLDCNYDNKQILNLFQSAAA